MKKKVIQTIAILTISLLGILPSCKHGSTCADKRKDRDNCYLSSLAVASQCAPQTSSQSACTAAYLGLLLCGEVLPDYCPKD